MSRAPTRGIAPISAAVAGHSFHLGSGREMTDTGDEDEDDFDINPPAMYSTQAGRSHMNPSRSSHTPEVFDYPALASHLYTIAQACQLPNEYMALVVQIAELGQWKSMQDDTGTLSYRELARRGKAIERVLLGQAPAQASPVSGYVSQVHNNLSITPTNTTPRYFSTDPYGSASTVWSQPLAAQYTTTSSPYVQTVPLTPPMGTYSYAQLGAPPSSAYPSSSTAYVSVPQSNFATTVAHSSPSQLILLDACLFMLHSVVSGPNPRVPELSAASRNITMRYSSIPANQRTLSLLFPLCIAGLLAENAESQYIQTQINSLGAPYEMVQVVNNLIANVRQARWNYEISIANPLMT
ncbi:hypothetical protein CPB86DRAFT_599621 [Serendipita vermifera]|nr:hypothetical protein CPB86DRAFT_599621 [Serendipita vermifera]